MLTLPLQQLIVIIPVILFSIVIHEYAHTFVAILLGDRSESNMARLTLNPIKHIDPIGFLMIIIVGFGWAKPVRINPNKFKNPVRDEILVSLAGPASNFILAFLILLVLKLLILNDVTITESLSFGFSNAIYINIALGVFNLLPIPPLDGSHIYTGILYQKNRALYINIMRYGSISLLFLIVASRISGFNFLPIGSITSKIFDFYVRVINL